MVQSIQIKDYLFFNLLLFDVNRYNGEFFQGLYHGLGVFTRHDGMKYEGQFQDGKIYGLGLLTFADGSNGVPRNEGYFENHKLMRHEKCTDMIDKAIAMAQRAIAQQTNWIEHIWFIRLCNSSVTNWWINFD